MAHSNRISIRFLAILLCLAVAIAFTPVFAASAQSSAATKLYANTTTYTVYVGGTQTVKVAGLSADKLKKVKWSTSDKAIAKISTTQGSSVKVTGVEAGKATVTAKYGSTSKKFTINVKAVPVDDQTKWEVKEIPTDSKTITGTAKQDSYIGGVIYQESAEVAALYMQAFVAARTQLDKEIKNNGGTGEGLAIVTDIDATLMDDSCYIAGALLNNAGRAELGLDPWDNDDWDGYYAAVATKADQAVPGAVDFVNYAYSKGVEFYYITNRPYYELDLTVKQLKEGGFNVDSIVEDYADLGDASKKLQEYHYWADGEGDDYNKEVLDYKKEVVDPSDFVMTDGAYTLDGDFRVQVQGSEFSSDKAERRYNVAQKVADEGGKVIMYMGDSINDMVSDKEYKYGVYKSANTSDAANTTLQAKREQAKAWRSFDFDRTNGNDNRTANVTQKYWAKKWGTEFIVMPNAAYGDWQKATWFKKSGVDQQAYMKDQLDRHSYLNAETWYKGTSPIGGDIQ